MSTFPESSSYAGPKNGSVPIDAVNPLAQKLRVRIQVLVNGVDFLARKSCYVRSHGTFG
jgi:hypothetical protein